MKINILFLLLLMTSFFNSQNRELINNCKINIENADLKIKVESFFKKNIVNNPNQLYFSESAGVVDTKQRMNGIKKTNLTELNLKNGFYEGENNTKNVALLYSVTRSYTEGEKLICYDSIWFSTFDILATNEDDFISLIAENRRLPENDLLKVTEKLKKTNKFQLTESKNFEILTFDFQSYSLIIKKAKKSYRTYIGVPGMPGQIEESLADVKFIILNKSATKNHLNWINKNDN